MPRLPVPGSDSGIWGNLLNEFLVVSHNNDGTLKASILASKADDSEVVHKTNAETIAGVKTFSSSPVVPTPSGNFSAATKLYVDDTLAAAITTVAAATGNASNDTAAIQENIDSVASSGGGIVKLVTGNEYVVTGVIIDTGVTLNLNGGGLILADGANAPVVATKDFDSLIGGDSPGGPHDFGIINGYLDGNKDNQTDNTKAVVALYGRRYTLDQLLIRNGLGTGLYSQWSTSSPFLEPNGFEAFVTRLYIHSCDGDGIDFRGPHDAYFSTFFIVKCGASAAATPLRLPDASGRANGSSFQQFHIYGGNGYNYGIIGNSAGVRFANFVVEGSQIAQVLVQAAQTQLDGFHIYPGSIQTETVVGIQIGDASHTGPNGCLIRGKIENCGGGALDVTYGGDNNSIELQHYYFLPSPVPANASLGVVGTISPLNDVDLDVVGPDFTKTAASFHRAHGQHDIDRTSDSDARQLLRLRDESGAALLTFDRYGRPAGVAAMGSPSLGIQAAAGGGASGYVLGSDVSGEIGLSIGTSPTSGLLTYVNFAHAWADLIGGPRVMLQPKNQAAAELGLVATSFPSASFFSITCFTAPQALAYYAWDYIVLG